MTANTSGRRLIKRWRYSIVYVARISQDTITGVQYILHNRPTCGAARASKIISEMLSIKESDVVITNIMKEGRVIYNAGN